MVRYNKISHFCCLTLKMANVSSQGHFATYHYILGFLNLYTKIIWGVLFVLFCFVLHHR